MAQDIAEFGGAEGRIHRVQDGAGLEGSEGGGDPLDRVAERHGDPVALDDAEPAKNPREAVGRAVELLERDGPALVQQVGIIRALAPVAFQVLEKQHRIPPGFAAPSRQSRGLLDDRSR